MSLSSLGSWLALCSALAAVSPAHADSPGARVAAQATPLDYDAQREVVREAKRELKLARVRALKAERARERAEQLPHLLAPHLVAQVGLSPIMVGRTNPDQSGSRFREGAVTLGAAYRRHYLWWLGLQAGLDLGMGPSHIGYASQTGSVEMSFTSKRTGPAYSSSLEVGPVFGPFRDFYVYQACQLRALWPGQRSARLVDTNVLKEQEVHDIRFPRALLIVGLRTGVGVILRARHEWDLGLGVDIAKPLYHADRAFGMFLRLGRVFEL